VGISLNSASDFVPLRPPVSLITAGVGRSEATLEFFSELKAQLHFKSGFSFLGFPERISMHNNLN
jgi:hypothetical protein